MKTAFLLFCSCFLGTFFSQTAGSGIISSMESKADQIVQNEEKIRNHDTTIARSYAEETRKLDKLKKELADLLREKDLVLDDFRQGYFCGGCQKPRSQFAQGETFPHEGQKIVPATPEQIASKEKEYDDKISRKEKELNDFELSENEFTRKRADLKQQITDLEAINQRLRDEIQQLSKKYRDVVVDESKSKHAYLVNELLILLAEKHHIENKIDILNVQLLDLQEAERKAIDQAMQKAKQQNDDDIRRENEKIAVAKRSLENLENKYRQDKATKEKELFDLRSTLKEVDLKLGSPSKWTQTELEDLKTQKQSLEASVSRVEQEIQSIESVFRQDKTLPEQDIKMATDKITELNYGLIQRQQKAADQVKEVYALKKKVINDAITARKINLQQKGDLLISKQGAARKKFLEYANKVSDESGRMVKACNRASVSCHGSDVHPTIVSNWNASLGCVGEMESHREISVYYGCEQEAPVYKQHLSMLSDGMSNEELSALQRSTNKTRYDLIYQKVTD